MDTVRALLVLRWGEPAPFRTDVEAADALIALPPDDPDQFQAAADRVDDLIALGPPLYLAAPPIDSGRARDYLAATLRPGVYGVVARPPASVDQLRYLESILEDLELRAEIRPGLTAMAIGVGTPVALSIIGEALAALRQSADRVVWLAWNPNLIAQALDVEPHSSTVAQSGAQVVLTAAAHNLPAVRWNNQTPSADDIAAARLFGFRGVATSDPAALPGLRDAFPAAPADDQSDDSD